MLDELVHQLAEPVARDGDRRGVVDGDANVGTRCELDVDDVDELVMGGAERHAAHATLLGARPAISARYWIRNHSGARSSCSGDTCGRKRRTQTPSSSGVAVSSGRKQRNISSRFNV